MTEPLAVLVLLGVSASTAWRYVNESRVPHPDIMRRIVEATGGAVGPQDFLRQYPTDRAPMPHLSWHRHDNLLLHLAALHALVLGMYAAMLRRDPELVRDVVDEGLSHVGSLPAEDRQVVRDIVDGLVRPMRGLAVLVVLLLAYPAAASQDRPDALFREGMIAVEAAQKPGLSEAARDILLDEAIAAFRAMLVADPGLARVRLELARAFFLKGEDRLARQHFERVLAGSPPPAVVYNVRRFLAEIRARRRWSLHFGFALAPDTNIGGSSDQRIITIYGLPFERDAEDLATSGIGASVWGGWAYQHPIGERFRARVGIDASVRDYAGSRFDRVFLAAHAGPRWLVDRDTDASLLASARRHWSAGAPDHDALGSRLEGAHRLTRRLTANARASWHERSYRTQTHLDGPAVDVSLGAAWVVTPTLRADAAAGWGRDRPEMERWRHERRWLRLGATTALPKGFTVGASGELRLADYEGNWFPHTLGEPREDRTYSIRLSVHNRAIAWKGFSPQLSLVHEVRDTNAQLYDYERTGGELRFVRVF